jgi:hypothetical protein
MGTRPDLAGKRLQVPGQAEVDLIDDNGTRRWIPDPDTYNNLFRNWSGIIQDIDTIEINQGPQISHGAHLAQAPGHAEVYLIDNGQKRWITSPAAMDKFYFDWNKIQPVSFLILGIIPSGPNIT